jgi:hypothetical protein
LVPIGISPWITGILMIQIENEYRCFNGVIDTTSRGIPYKYSGGKLILGIGV